LSTTESKSTAPAPTGQRVECWVAAFRQPRDRTEGAPPPLRVELPGGLPPSVAASGRSQAIFDGWLYNREELRALGGAAEDADDATVLLLAYGVLGKELAARIKGRFALLVWDGDANELVAVRDPLGTYPIFWAERGDEVLFSPGIEELVRRPGVSAELNRAVLAQHLCSRAPNNEDTYFASARRILPGHVHLLSAAGRRSYRYWHPVPYAGSDDWVGEDELERFDLLFDQAVSRCLEPGPAGILLSGGLDSVSVAAVATDLSRRRGMPAPCALSLGFPHPDCDEEAIQRQIAAQLDLEQVFLRLDEAVAPRGRVMAAVEDNRLTPTPLMAIWQSPYWRLAEEGRRRGCRVILTGGGGDDILLASTYYAADLLQRLRFVRLWRLYRTHNRSLPGSAAKVMKNTFWECAARPLLQRSFRKAAKRAAPGWLRERWRRQIEEGTPAWVTPDAELSRELIACSLGRASSWPPLDTDFYYHECRTALDHVTVSLDMERVFEDGRRSGVPIQEPFWDADLQEFLYRVPPEWLIKGRRTKGLVRGMLAQRFPELGFERQIKVIGSQFANETVVDELPAALRSIGGARALGDLGIVDPQRLEDAVQRMGSDPRDSSLINCIWHAFSLETWVRAHG
jgi:asparagine synthase (glutamine-hydrolysing)